MDTRLRLLEVSEALVTKRLDDHEHAMRELGSNIEKIDGRLEALVDRLGSMERKLVGCAVLIAVALSGKTDAAGAAVQGLIG